MSLYKIVVIGAGAVGASTAAIMAQRHLGSIFLYDTVEDLALGKAMDINQASPALHTDCRVVGSDSPEVLKRADLVVFSAGSARHTGMTRLDLLMKNLCVARQIGGYIMDLCPEARVLVVTNPVDVLTWFLKKTWPEMNVFGLGCSLDTLRFKYFIAEAVGLSVEHVQGLVIGTHNDDMIPLVNHATVSGIPLPGMADKETISRIVRLTKEAGTTIVQKLRQHSGFYSASHVVARIMESAVHNRLAVFPLSVVCSGEYGYKNIALALPSVVGRNGIKQVLEIDLDAQERSLLDICATSMTGIIRDLEESSISIEMENACRQ